MTEGEFCPVCCKAPSTFDTQRHKDGCALASIAQGISLMAGLVLANDRFWGEAPLEEGPVRDRLIGDVAEATEKARAWLASQLPTP